MVERRRYPERTPGSYPEGLTGWWDASSPIMRGTYAEGDQVSTWYDISGLGRDLTQGTAGNRPLFRHHSSGSRLPGVDFDGTSDRLDSTLAISNFITNSAMSSIVVITVDTADVDNVGYATETVWSTIADAYIGIAIRGISGAPQLLFWNYDANYDVIGGMTFTERVGINNPTVGWMTHTGGNLFGHYNSSSVSSVASGNTGGLTHLLRFGANHGTGFFLDGRIHEVAIWNRALGVTDMLALKYSLERKWSMKYGGYS